MCGAPEPGLGNPCIKDIFLSGHVVDVLLHLKQ